MTHCSNPNCGLPFPGRATRCPHCGQAPAPSKPWDVLFPGRSHGDFLYVLFSAAVLALVVRSGHSALYFFIKLGQEGSTTPLHAGYVIYNLLPILVGIGLLQRKRWARWMAFPIASFGAMIHLAGIALIASGVPITEMMSRISDRKLMGNLAFNALAYILLAVLAALTNKDAFD